MNLKFLKDEKEQVEVMIEGEDHSFPNAMREKLLGMEGVEFVSVTRDHPTAAHPKLVLKMKGKNAREALKAAAKSLLKDSKDFGAQIKKKA